MLTIKNLKKQEGFTLIELLAVIVIIAIIAAIAIPSILGIINKSRNNANIATAVTVYKASQLFLQAENAGDFTSEFVPVVGTGTVYTPERTTVATAGAGLMTMNYLPNTTIMPSNRAPITGGHVLYEADGTLHEVVLSSAANSWVFSAAVINTGAGNVEAVARIAD
ncbi:prepilin-type N-terminal cleavage/methylation domain-containing protein [Paenibacillus sp. N3.4]|uniref:prepilin-type N-terminal cleavage/methylation domain-containing protein n=1 Tax=Paenibacillus sp. N3.4 TaxID=2603222 RepID=UPI0011CBBB8E|nr:prepilin-type N-terminal cleavage/methylation domain-containing protein [Paenibacillus sp. N3.4]TXK85390.1 prepilin-type N-terminal cleavage/methylation domain-containing protein [Paenibacillus sp. N3.4]